MKKTFYVLFSLFLFSFVVADSEITTNFIIKGTGSSVNSHIFVQNFLNNYEVYIVGIIILFIILFFIYKARRKMIVKKRKLKRSSKKIVKKKR